MTWKKLLGIATVAFLIYFLVRAPVESATAVDNAASAIGDFASSLAVSLTTFIQTLF